MRWENGINNFASSICSHSLHDKDPIKQISIQLGKRKKRTENELRLLTESLGACGLGRARGGGCTCDVSSSFLETIKWLCSTPKKINSNLTKRETQGQNMCFQMLTFIFYFAVAVGKR